MEEVNSQIADLLQGRQLMQLSEFERNVYLEFIKQKSELQKQNTLHLQQALALSTGVTEGTDMLMDVVNGPEAKAFLEAADLQNDLGAATRVAPTATYPMGFDAMNTDDDENQNQPGNQGYFGGRIEYTGDVNAPASMLLEVVDEEDTTRGRSKVWRASEHDAPAQDRKSKKARTESGVSYTVPDSSVASSSLPYKFGRMSVGSTGGNTAAKQMKKKAQDTYIEEPGDPFSLEILPRFCNDPRYSEQYGDLIELIEDTTRKAVLKAKGNVPFYLLNRGRMCEELNAPQFRIDFGLFATAVRGKKYKLALYRETSTAKGAMWETFKTEVTKYKGNPRFELSPNKCTNRDGFAVLQLPAFCNDARYSVKYGNLVGGVKQLHEERMREVAIDADFRKEFESFVTVVKRLEAFSKKYEGMYKDLACLHSVTEIDGDGKEKVRSVGGYDVNEGLLQAVMDTPAFEAHCKSFMSYFQDERAKCEQNKLESFLDKYPKFKGMPFEKLRLEHAFQFSVYPDALRDYALTEYTEYTTSTSTSIWESLWKIARPCGFGTALESTTQKTASQAAPRGHSLYRRLRNLFLPNGIDSDEAIPKDLNISDDEDMRMLREDLGFDELDDVPFDDSLFK